MNKIFKTILFLAAATLACLVVMIGSWLLLLLIFERTVPLLPPGWFFQGFLRQFLVVLSILVSVALTFVAYHFGLKLIVRKVDMDKHFLPFLKGKQGRA